MGNYSYKKANKNAIEKFIEKTVQSSSMQCYRGMPFQVSKMVKLKSVHVQCMIAEHVREYGLTMKISFICLQCIPMKIVLR